METEQALQSVPKLRRKRSEDGSNIAVTVKKKLKKCHLYFHGPGKLGIYWEGWKGCTQRQEQTVRRYWLKKIPPGSLIEELPGDFDGIILFKATVPSDIPDDFILTERGFGGSS